MTAGSAACVLQDEMERANHEGAPAMPLTIVFVERKNRCNEVADALNAEGVPALPLHGGLSQVRGSTAGFAASSCFVIISSRATTKLGTCRCCVPLGHATCRTVCVSKAAFCDQCCLTCHCVCSMNVSQL